ncbi:MAG: RDD family protein [Candidatus Enteromonas sp.]|nr:RDD family protein [Candidatus Enteromonas sp.]
MSRTKIPSYIKPAGILRNSVGFFIDVLFFLLFGTIFYISLGRPVVYRSWLQGDAHYAQYEKLAIASGFSYVDEEGKAVDYVPNGRLTGKEYYLQFQKVEELVWNYYYVVIPSDPDFVFLPEDEFVSTHEEGSQGYATDVGKWIYETVFRVFEQEANHFWAVPDEGFDYATMPSLNAETQAALSSSDLDVATAKAKDVFVSLYYRGEGSEAIYQTAQNHFLSQPRAKSESNAYKTATLMAFAPSIVISPILSFLLPSVLFRDGRSFGKKAMKIAVISDSGYKASKGQLAIRGLILCLPVWLNLIPHPFITLPVTTLLFLADYMVLVMHKNHQSIHDLVARTLTVRSDLSLWFANEEIEEEYIASHPSSLPAKWKNGESASGGRKYVSHAVPSKEELGILDASCLPKNLTEPKAEESVSQENFTDQKE